MITDALISVVFGVLVALLGALPEWEPNLDGIEAATGPLGSWLSTANGYFPVTVLGACLATVLGLKLILWGWGFLVWLYEKIPFV